MKNYKIWLAVILSLLIINSAVLAIVWFRKGEHRHIERPLPPAAPDQGMQQQPKDIIIKSLALTTQQQSAYFLMVNDHIATTRKLNEANHKLRDSLFSYIKKQLVDSAVINSITKKISDNQAGMDKATLYHFRQLRKILTPAQQTKFDGIINDVLHMMAGQGAPGGPGRREPDGGISPTVVGHMHRHIGMPPLRDRMGEERDLPPPPDGMPPPRGDHPGDRRGPPPDGISPQGDHRGPPPNDGALSPVNKQ